MSRFDLGQEVASVVAAAPRTSRVFEKHGIDYCCGGKIPLEKACAARGVDAKALLVELEAAVAVAKPDVDWTNEPLPALVEHILSKHHAFVHRELPRLSMLMDKVYRVHGERHPETLPEMWRIWKRVSFELDQHMMKEEEILFPMIRSMAEGGPAGGHCGGVEGPIRVMEWEHEEAGKAFARLRVLANGYVPDADACGSWRALWSGLDEFEQDLHVHVHLENYVLYPRALELSGTCTH